VDELREGHPHSILVSAGDLIGGSPLVSALFHDEPTIAVMDAVGLALNGVGNHEFDEGVAEVQRLQEGGCHPLDGCAYDSTYSGSEFRFLAANVVETSTGQTAFAPYEIVEFDGIPVAFIGMTLEATPTIVAAEGIVGWEFRDEVETVDALLPELQGLGIEAIVVLLHEGGFASGGFDGCSAISGPVVEVVEALDPAVDAVITGHTHQAYNCVVNDVPVTSASSYGRVLTTLDIVLERASGDVVSIAAENHIVTRDLEDPGVKTMVDEAGALVAPLANTEVGSIAETLTKGGSSNGQSALGRVIADAQRASTAPLAAGGADFALMNPGGIRADLAYPKSGSEGVDGTVTYGEAFTTQPFANTLVTMTLTGAQVKAALEQQWQGSSTIRLQVSENFTYSYDDGNAIGSRVVAMAVGGVPLGASDTVRVCVNSFLAGGGDGFTVFTEGTDLVGGPVDLDALLDYFAAQSPISAPPNDRVTAL
jgi:5'-nucleotidase